MLFSFIIVNYKTKELTKNCINSILKNCAKGEFEIIVVDNASNDGSVEGLKGVFEDEIKIIYNKENLGFGRANNQGVKIAKGKYLFFLNSDTIIKNNILFELGKFFDENFNTGIVAPKLLLEDGSEQPFAFGNYPGVLSIIIDKFKSTLKYLNQSFEVEWVSGAALIIKREVFINLNGFDEKFFMYFEDIDLCKMVKDRGLKIMVYPDVSIVHLFAKSPSRFARRKKMYYESQDYFYRKHYGVLIMLIMKIMRLPYVMLVVIFKK